MQSAFRSPVVLGCGLLDLDKFKVIRGGWQHGLVRAYG